MRRALLCTLLLVASPALASGPRLLAAWDDPTEDVTIYPFAVWVATPETDVKRVSFLSIGDDFVIQYDVVDLSHRTMRDRDVRGVGLRMEEVFHFVFSGRSLASGLRGVDITAVWLPPRFGAAAGPHFAMWLTDMQGTCITCDSDLGILRGDWDEVNDRVTIYVPGHWFQGDITETNLWSHVILPTSSNSITGTLTLGDLVPDDMVGGNVPTS